jgi:hypothetical protein
MKAAKEFGRGMFTLQLGKEAGRCFFFKSHAASSCVSPAQKSACFLSFI